MGFAAFADRLLLHMISGGPDIIPLDVSINLRLLLFNLAVTVATALLFGIVPALRGTRVDLTDALKDGRGPSSGTSRSPIGKVLIVAQVAISACADRGSNFVYPQPRQSHQCRYRLQSRKASFVSKSTPTSPGSRVTIRA